VTITSNLAEILKAGPPEYEASVLTTLSLFSRHLTVNIWTDACEPQQELNLIVKGSSLKSSTKYVTGD
jgi:hypothetical protein